MNCRSWEQKKKKDKLLNTHTNITYIFIEDKKKHVENWFFIKRGMSWVCVNHIKCCNLTEATWLVSNTDYQVDTSKAEGRAYHSCTHDSSETHTQMNNHPQL